LCSKISPFFLSTRASMSDSLFTGTVTVWPHSEQIPLNIWVFLITVVSFSWIQFTRQFHEQKSDCVKTKNWFRKLRLLCIESQGKTNHMLKTSNFMKTNPFKLGFKDVWLGYGI